MGWGGDHTAWAFQVAALAAEFDVIAFDNRGAGQSDVPDLTYSMADMAGDVAGLMDELGVRSAHVAGASMGGMIAQELAIAHPQRVGRLIVALSFARPEALRRTFLLHRRWARLHGADPISESIAYLPWLLSPATMNDGSRLAAILDLVGTMPFMAADAYAHQVDAILEHRTLDRLAQVRAPTLVVAAPEDVLTPVGLSEEIAAAIPGAQLALLPRGGHGVLIEYADDFNRTVLEWLGQAGAEE
jgi:3-oxoadipate enol-lactonase